MAAMRDLLSVTTAIVLAVVWACNVFLTSETGAFTVGSFRPQLPTASSLGADVFTKGSQGIASRGEALGVKGLFCFGMGFGVLLATTRSRLARRAEGKDIAVQDKAAVSKIAYLENVPRTMVEKATLEKLLAATPREQWEDPPEDSFLYSLKMYTEVYGPGKATKMGWWDYYRMRAWELPGPEDIRNRDIYESIDRYNRALMMGKLPMAVPGPSGWWYTGALIDYRPKEPFSAEVRTPLTEGRFSKMFIQNTAFYREGLKPWQRGIEIGMAHGYFIIGPFVSLGPLRDTPVAATVGLLCGCAIIGLVSAGGLLAGTTLKPTLFDKEGDEAGSGWQEVINWHAVGGLGGAGFAHALLTVFGSF